MEGEVARNLGMARRLDFGGGCGVAAQPANRGAWGSACGIIAHPLVMGAELGTLYMMTKISSL